MTVLGQGPHLIKSPVYQDIVVYNYNASYLRGRDRGIMVRGQPRQKKLARLYLKKQARCGGTFCNPRYLELEVGESQSKSSPRQKLETLSEKIN
jgi:hypothetical protein